MTGRTRLIAVAAVLAAGAAIAAGFLWGRSKAAEEAARPAVHLTIYLDRPIVTEGGAVIVAGRELSEEEWRRLPEKPNPTATDPENPKHTTRKAGSRLIGAVVSSPVTLVEFFYPENGSYTFDFQLVPGLRHEGTLNRDLRTQRVSIGSGSRMTDPGSPDLIDYASMSTIVVLGPGRDASWARLADATFHRALDKPDLVIAQHQDVRTLALTPEQIRDYVVDTQQ